MNQEDPNDSKHKSFTAQVDKSLKGFEYSTEWADLISALGRLIKVIQSNAKARHIPRSFLVGKRLAQCLHPALPPGVHCKALECYDVIFRTIGPEKVARDLPVYGSGLFTLLGPSAMTVKPPLFDVFEEHLLPLGQALHPAFVGLLQGLLPGLEQGAEFFERGNRTIEMFCAAVGPRFFYTCLWKLMIYSPSVRMFGISFVINHFNRRKALSEQNYIYGLDKRILLHSLCCLCGDSMLLVQRDALDFLQLALPIHLYAAANGPMLVGGEPLTMADYADICEASLCVLLRRDASLNRRLFLWLKGGQMVESMLGTQQPSPLAHSVMTEDKLTELQQAQHPTDLEQAVQDHYFATYSRALLIEAFLRVIHHPDQLPLESQLVGLWGSGSASLRPPFAYFAFERAVAERPFRLVTGLLDRGDLGGAIIEDLLPDLLWYTCREFYQLRNRSLAWMSGVSTAIIRRTANHDAPANETPANMITLMADHVAAKESTRLLHQQDRLDDASVCPELATDPPLTEDNSAGTIGTQTQQSTTYPSIRDTPRADSKQLTYADEFLRTAHLFLSNLQGDFLWGFIERQFGALLLSPTIAPDSLVSVCTTANGFLPPLTLSLDRLCQIVRFLLTHLPMDTYPGVRGYHLPRLVTHIMDCLLARCKLPTTSSGTNENESSNQNRRPVTAAEMNNVLHLLDSVVSQIFEYIIMEFDRTTMLATSSFTGSVHNKNGMNPAKSTGDLMVIASAIGKFRQFLGAFCVNILEFSPDQLLEFLYSLMPSGRSHLDDKDRSSRSHRPNRILFAVNRSWLDLFSRLCYLLVQMSNFPLLVSEQQLLHMPANVDVEASTELSGLMTLFCGDLVVSPKTGERILPEWLVCLLYAATEVNCFDLKAIALYTLFELFHASTSVHGWTTPNAAPSDEAVRNPAAAVPDSQTGPAATTSGKVRLTLPVLSGPLLSYLASQTTIFLRLGISLWDYLSPDQSTYNEDAVNLLVRLHQLAPPVSGSGSITVPSSTTIESFILAQMRSSDIRTQVDAQARFALLWHLMRAAPVSKQPNPSSSNHRPSVGSPNQFSPPTKVWTRLASVSGRNIAASCWRRFSMGLQRLNDQGGVGLAASGEKTSSVSAKISSTHGLHTIPFYRCALLLLDNLDVDSPWGPVGSMGTADAFSISPSCLTNTRADWFTDNWTADTQSTGLVQAVLREQAVQWVCRALRTGQVDRLIAPLLAALLHPATVRISLKARVLQQADQARRARADQRHRRPPAANTEALRTRREQTSDTCDGQLQGDGTEGDTGPSVNFTVSSDEDDVDNVNTSDETVKQRTKLDPARNPDVFFGDRQPVDLMSMLQHQLQVLHIDSTKHLNGFRRKLVSADSIVAILPLHEHLVVHLQNYDANQVIYALSRIRAILTVAPTLFVHALVTAPVTTGTNGDRSSTPSSSLCLFGLSLAELLTRHRRALAGGNFYGPASQDELVQTLRTQANLLEVLINLCLVVMCSQLPYAGQTANGQPTAPGKGQPPAVPVCASRYEFTEAEFRANKCAQKTAVEVLELIVRELVRTKRGHDSTGPHVHTLQMTDRQGGSSSVSNLKPAGNSRSNRPLYTSANMLPDRRWIQATARRTCLVSAVLHCLATAVEVAHWPSNTEPWLLSDSEFTSLPTCLRLLMVNELSADLPPRFHSIYCSSLVRLMQAVLELQMWWPSTNSLGRSARTDSPTGFVAASAAADRQCYSGTIWPISRVTGDHDTPSHQTGATVTVANDSSVFSTSPKRVIKLWMDAFLSLPEALTCEPLFRTACLTAHWPCGPSQMSQTTTTNHHREQGALLMDILSLGLSAPRLETVTRYGLVTRPDLHPIWYQFVFTTLSCWGIYTPQLTRAVVTQICINLIYLGQRVLGGLATTDESINTTAYENTDQPRTPSTFLLNSLPPDYVLASLACLQGIFHALMLPGGNATTAALLRKATNPLAPDPPSGVLSASQLAGLPESVTGAAELAETLSGLIKPNSAIIVETSPDMATTFDDIFPPSGVPPTNSMLSNPVGSLVTVVENSAPVEPSVVLATSTSSNGDQTSDVPRESSLSSPEFTAIFTSRTKDLFVQNNSPQPNAHPLVQAQTELYRLLPRLLRCLAVLWNALNESPWVPSDDYTIDGPTYGFEHRDAVSGVPSCTVTPVADRLPALIALGSPSVVRPALRLFLEPLVLQHPSAFLINMALVWPSSLLTPDNSIGFRTCFGSDNALTTHGPVPLLKLLTPLIRDGRAGLSSKTPLLSSVSDRLDSDSSRTLLLLPEQTNLLRLLSGSATSSDGPADFGLILPISQFVNHIRDLVRRPLHNAIIISESTAGSNMLASNLQNSDASSNTTMTTEYQQNRRAWSAIRLQVNLLHMFYAWLIEQPRLISSDLLLTLLRDLINIPVATSQSAVSTTSSGSATLPPVAVFILVKIFHEYLNLTSISDDRREQRELQELCHRLLESTASVAASALEQPSWFRRTLHVRQQDDNDGEASGSTTLSELDLTKTSVVRPATLSMSNSMSSSNLNFSSTSGMVLNRAESPCPENARLPHVTSVVDSSTPSMLMDGTRRFKTGSDLSIQAMDLLSEHMASFLDVVYRSDEKDRIPTFLTLILNNVFPYLRVRMASNSDRFLAASQLLASVSSYQYTRRAWRRETLDLFYEPVFFQMSPVAMQNWNIIVDNLMTQDKNTFKEALARLTFSQPTGLNLFSNKEVEHDLRAACLKKLSYLVYASEADQYAKSMPDFLERLTECLRLGQGLVPQVHAQVFVFSRTLLSRMSSMQLTSLWPIIIPELIMVFKFLSNQLSQPSLGKERRENQKPSSSAPTPTNPSAKELSMYLGACKFLATCLLVPEYKAPQFPFYRWVFVGESLLSQQRVDSSETVDSPFLPSFVPFVTDVTRLLQQSEVVTECRSTAGQPQPQQRQSHEHYSLVQGCLYILALDKINSFSELAPFLYSLEGKINGTTGSTDSNTAKENGVLLELALEAALAREFPESLASR